MHNSVSLPDYETFIERRARQSDHRDSITVDCNELNPMLYNFQRDIVRWALAKGRAVAIPPYGTYKTEIE